jgi:hypothetical protein
VLDRVGGGWDLQLRERALLRSAAGAQYFTNQVAQALVLTASGNGYWISAASGGVYSYGDAQFYGAA